MSDAEPKSEITNNEPKSEISDFQPLKSLKKPKSYA